MKPTGPGQSPQLLSEVVREIDTLGIRYAVIGALAASFHGMVRASLDADALIWTGGDAGLVEKLKSRLREGNLQVEHGRGSLDDPADSVLGVTDRFGNRVDLLTGIRGLSSDFLSRTIAAPVLDTILEMIGAEDLIAMKLFAGSPQDLQDARGVMDVSSEALDHELLEKLAAAYGPETSRRLTALKST